MNPVDEFAKAIIFSGFFGIALFGFLLWLYALISALKNERLDSTMKLTWVLVILFVPLVGPLIYLCVAPHRPTRSESTFQSFLVRQNRAQRDMQHRTRSAKSMQKHRATLPPEVGS